MRVIAGVTKGNPGYENIGLLAVGAYFLFVITSWVINPLANVFLLFHKDGRYALHHSEKWNAIAFMICLFSGVTIMILSSIAVSSGQASNFILSGLITVSLGVPTGHMTYPIRLKQNSVSQWIAILLILLAILSVLIAISGYSSAIFFFGAYCVVFVAYSWMN